MSLASTLKAALAKAKAQGHWEKAVKLFQGCLLTGNKLKDLPILELTSILEAHSQWQVGIELLKLKRQGSSLILRAGAGRVTSKAWEPLIRLLASTTSGTSHVPLQYTWMASLSLMAEMTHRCGKTIEHSDEDEHSLIDFEDDDEKTKSACLHLLLSLLGTPSIEHKKSSERFHLPGESAEKCRQIVQSLSAMKTSDKKFSSSPNDQGCGVKKGENRQSSTEVTCSEGIPSNRQEEKFPLSTSTPLLFSQVFSLLRNRSDGCHDGHKKSIVEGDEDQQLKHQLLSQIALMKKNAQKNVDCNNNSSHEDESKKDDGLHPHRFASSSWIEVLDTVALLYVNSFVDKLVVNRRGKNQTSKGGPEAQHVKTGEEPNPFFPYEFYLHDILPLPQFLAVDSIMVAFQHRMLHFISARKKAAEDGKGIFQTHQPQQLGCRPTEDDEKIKEEKDALYLSVYKFSLQRLLHSELMSEVSRGLFLRNYIPEELWYVLKIRYSLEELHRDALDSWESTVQLNRRKEEEEGKDRPPTTTDGRITAEMKGSDVGPVCSPSSSKSTSPSSLLSPYLAPLIRSTLASRSKSLPWYHALSLLHPKYLKNERTENSSQKGIPKRASVSECVGKNREQQEEARRLVNYLPLFNTSFVCRLAALYCHDHAVVDAIHAHLQVPSKLKSVKKQLGVNIPVLRSVSTVDDIKLHPLSLQQFVAESARHLPPFPNAPHAFLQVFGFLIHGYSDLSSTMAFSDAFLIFRQFPLHVQMLSTAQQLLLETLRRRREKKQSEKNFVPHHQHYGEFQHEEGKNLSLLRNVAQLWEYMTTHEIQFGLREYAELIEVIVPFLQDFTTSSEHQKIQEVQTEDVEGEKQKLSNHLLRDILRGAFFYRAKGYHQMQKRVSALLKNSPRPFLPLLQKVVDEGMNEYKEKVKQLQKNILSTTTTESFSKFLAELRAVFFFEHFGSTSPTEATLQVQSERGGKDQKKLFFLTTVPPQFINSILRQIEESISPAVSSTSSLGGNPANKDDHNVNVSKLSSFVDQQCRLVLEVAIQLQTPYVLPWLLQHWESLERVRKLSSFWQKEKFDVGKRECDQEESLKKTTGLFFVVVQRWVETRRIKEVLQILIPPTSEAVGKGAMLVVESEQSTTDNGGVNHTIKNKQEGKKNDAFHFLTETILANFLILHRVEGKKYSNQDERKTVVRFLQTCMWRDGLFFLNGAKQFLEASQLLKHWMHLLLLLKEDDDHYSEAPEVTIKMGAEALYKMHQLYSQHFPTRPRSEAFIAVTLHFFLSPQDYLQEVKAMDSAAIVRKTEKSDDKEKTHSIPSHLEFLPLLLQICSLWQMDSPSLDFRSSEVIKNALHWTALGQDLLKFRESYQPLYPRDIALFLSGRHRSPELGKCLLPFFHSSLGVDQRQSPPQNFDFSPLAFQELVERQTLNEQMIHATYFGKNLVNLLCRGEFNVLNNVVGKVPNVTTMLPSIAIVSLCAHYLSAEGAPEREEGERGKELKRNTKTSQESLQLSTSQQPSCFHSHLYVSFLCRVLFYLKLQYAGNLQLLPTNDRAALASLILLVLYNVSLLDKKYSLPKNKHNVTAFQKEKSIHDFEACYLLRESEMLRRQQMGIVADLVSVLSDLNSPSRQALALSTLNEEQMQSVRFYLSSLQ